MKMSENKILAELQAKKRHKYGAVATTVDGIRFASKKEAKRYGELKQAKVAKRGGIADLVLQPKYPVDIQGHDGKWHKICTYKADFQYWDIDKEKTVIEDVKGYKKGQAYQMFRIKKKLVEAIYGITITEI